MSCGLRLLYELLIVPLYDPAGLPNQLGDSLKVGLDYG